MCRLAVHNGIWRTPTSNVVTDFAYKYIPSLRSVLNEDNKTIIDKTGYTPSYCPPY